MPRFNPSYEYEFRPGTPNNTAATIYELALEGGVRLLDLGSGRGIVSSYLQMHDGREVTCVDSSLASLDVAKQSGVSRTILADLSSRTWHRSIDGEQFDVIVMADVLEHLANPEDVLATITRRDLLADGGRLVISVPNAAHESLIAELIVGRFEYQETGLLDATHLRFFTLESLTELLHRHGFHVTKVHRIRRTAEQTSLGAGALRISENLRKLINDESTESTTYQLVVRAECEETAGQLARTEQAPVDARANLIEADSRLDRFETDLADHEQIRLLLAETAAAAIRHEERASREAETRHMAEQQLEESQTNLEDLKARLAESFDALSRERKNIGRDRLEFEKELRKRTLQAKELTKQQSEANKQAARLQRELDKTYASNTWKAGRVVRRVFHTPKRAISRLWGHSRQPAEPESAERSLPVPAAQIDYVLIENGAARESYEKAISRSEFSNPNTGRNVIIGVYTVSFEEGRGDVFVAVGLGRHLERLGYEVVYLPHDRWYDIPDGADIYISMLETVEISQLPSSLTKVAWVRNQTTAWSELPWLAAYDLILCSSQRSLIALRGAFPGPTGHFPIVVDTDLFVDLGHQQDRVGVVATQNHWGTEREVHRHLRTRPPEFPLALYGQNRGISPDLARFSRGLVSYFSLPSLYNQAAVVLDDFNHSTAPFGNVNSRLFEVLACGSMVMTNQALGLEELGLDEVPTYDSADDLNEKVGKLISDSKSGDAARKLRDVVLDRHTFAVRAKELHAHLERLATPSLGLPKPNDRSMLAFYPDYRENPFQQMLWTSLRESQSVPVLLDKRFDVAFLERAATGQRVAFHLNWTAPILGAASDSSERFGRYRTFLNALDRLSRAGVPTIWTVHNVLPHECADPRLEARFRQEIANRVDSIHVMCPDTPRLVASHYQLPMSKVRVIQHPSYVDVYPNVLDQSTARHELDLRTDHTVFLFLGDIRPYKHVDKLLQAFDQVWRAKPKSRLIVAGRLGRFEGVTELEARARAHPAVLTNFDRIPDDNIQLYMNAADVAVLPYPINLNSGALLLAYSFGRPVIAADTPCASHLLHPDSSEAYEWDGTPAPLAEAMERSDHLRSRAAENSAYSMAAANHYRDAAQRFEDLVEEAWSLRGCE